MPEIGELQQIQQGSVHVMGVSSGTMHMMSLQQGQVVPTRGLPKGGATGDLLAKRSDADYAVEWITPANAVEEDNTRPITAAAVYTEVGNINALLATI